MNRLANGVRTYSSIVQAQFQNGGTRFGSGFNNLCKATAAVFQKIILKKKVRAAADDTVFSARGRPHLLFFYLFFLSSGRGKAFRAPMVL